MRHAANVRPISTRSSEGKRAVTTRRPRTVIRDRMTQVPGQLHIAASEPRAEYGPKFEDAATNVQVRAVWRWDCKSVGLLEAEVKVLTRRFRCSLRCAPGRLVLRMIGFSLQAHRVTFGAWTRRRRAAMSGDMGYAGELRPSRIAMRWHVSSSTTPTRPRSSYTSWRPTRGCCPSTAPQGSLYVMAHPTHRDHPVTSGPPPQDEMGSVCAPA